MQDVLNILKNYWPELLAILLFIASFILQLARKKPITKIYDSSMYRNLSILIKEAEDKFGSGHGSDKLEYVLNRYCQLYNVEPSIWNLTSIKACIEFILSIPQKHENK